jgi:hypothetical protein
MEALAEVLWTPPARKDFADFFTRLSTADIARLDALDVRYRSPALTVSLPKPSKAAHHR